MKYKLRKAGAIILLDRSVLYVKRKGFPYYILPGGRLEEGESAEEALRREMLEELSTSVTVEKELGQLSGEGVSSADGKPFELELSLFQIRPNNTIVLSSEIVEMQYLNSITMNRKEMTEIGLDTIDYLKHNNLID